MKHRRHGLRRATVVSGGGFSLLELLLVIGILLILVTLYWSPAKGSRQRSLRIVCQRNLERLYLAQQIFAEEHNSKFPVVAGATKPAEPLALLVPRYTSDLSTFVCPASKDAAPSDASAFAKARLSYAYYMGRALTNGTEALMSDAQVDNQPKLPGQSVFSATGQPPGNNHGQSGGNFLFGDGHITHSPANAAFPLALEPGVVLLNP
jgi:prepilin-type N-terminal cleavage/methylation domain-containing protein/prepilin-type processing-associated H-X9-DG protein